MILFSEMDGKVITPNSKQWNLITPRLVQSLLRQPEMKKSEFDKILKIVIFDLCAFDFDGFIPERDVLHHDVFSEAFKRLNRAFKFMFYKAEIRKESWIPEEDEIEWIILRAVRDFNDAEVVKNVVGKEVYYKQLKAESNDMKYLQAVLYSIVNSKDGTQEISDLKSNDILSEAGLEKLKGKFDKESALEQFEKYGFITKVPGVGYSISKRMRRENAKELSKLLEDTDDVVLRNAILSRVLMCEESDVNGLLA